MSRALDLFVLAANQEAVELTPRQRMNHLRIDVKLLLPLGANHRKQTQWNLENDRGGSRS